MPASATPACRVTRRPPSGPCRRRRLGHEVCHRLSPDALLSVCRPRPFSSSRLLLHDHRPPSRGPRRRTPAHGRRLLPGRRRRQGRAGRPQRRRQDDAHQDPGRRGAARVRLGDPRPASVGYLPQDPRTGDPEVLALHRILSARGLDEVVRRLRRGRGRDGVGRPGRPRPRDAPLRAGRRRAARRRRLRRRGRGPADRLQPRTSRTGSSTSRCAPCPAASAGASSWPGSCSPAPRRCCSTSPPTTSTPTRSSGCGTSSSPTRAA